MRLQGKTVVITGASRGLGAALAARFAEEGARLALCARSSDGIETVGERLRSKGVECLTGVCDISNSVQVEAFARDVLDKYSAVDILVNNAALLGERKLVVDIEPSAWDEVIQTNLHGTFFVTRSLLRGMIQQGSGCIINVSSSVGRAARKTWGAYAVSKFGIEGFTQLLAEEVRSFNVRVNAVNPGPISTDMRRSAYPGEDASILRTPDSIAEVFVYLASDDGKGITGQSIDASSFVSNPGMLS